MVIAERYPRSWLLHLFQSALMNQSNDQMRVLLWGLQAMALSWSTVGRTGGSLFCRKKITSSVRA